MGNYRYCRLTVLVDYLVNRKDGENQDKEDNCNYDETPVDSRLPWTRKLSLISFDRRRHSCYLFTTSRAITTVYFELGTAPPAKALF